MVTGQPCDDDARVTITDGDVLLKPIVNSADFRETRESGNRAAKRENKDDQQAAVHARITRRIWIVTRELNLETELGLEQNPRDHNGHN